MHLAPHWMGPVVCVCVWVCDYVCLGRGRVDLWLVYRSAIPFKWSDWRRVSVMWRVYSPPTPANLCKLCKLTIKLKRYIIITRDRARSPIHLEFLYYIFSRKHNCRRRCLSQSIFVERSPRSLVLWSFQSASEKNAPLRRGKFQSIIHDYYQLTHADICNCRAIRFHYGRYTGWSEKCTGPSV